MEKEKRFKELLFCFYQGATSEEEETELFALFTEEEIAKNEKYSEDMALLHGLAALKTHEKNIKRQEKILKTIDDSNRRKKRISLILFQATGMAVAACIAAFLFLKTPINDTHDKPAEKQVATLPSVTGKCENMPPKEKIKMAFHKNETPFDGNETKRHQTQVQEPEKECAEQACEVQEVAVNMPDSIPAQIVPDAPEEQIAEQIYQPSQTEERVVRIESDRLIKYKRHRMIRFENIDDRASNLYPFTLPMGCTHLSEKKK